MFCGSHCILCGCPCTAQQVCRVADTDAVQKNVALRCAPTSFHYQAVLKLPSNTRCILCIHCINWRRRSQRFTRGRSPLGCPRRSCFTPLDSILLHALAPGAYSDPDTRCFQRLARLAADTGNLYASLIPESVRQTLNQSLEDRKDKPYRSNQQP